MSSLSILSMRSFGGALCGAAAALWLAPAYPHAVCGDRIFPATIAIDDPGVTDELTTPFLEWLPQNPNGVEEYDLTWNWAKTIFPNFQLSVGSGPTWQHPGGYGWEPLDTEAKYQFFCIPEQEFMGSVGFIVNWGNTGTGTMAGPPSFYSPVLDVGKGFGDLPTSMKLLRPFAVTGALSTVTPGQAFVNGTQYPTAISYGFTIQYSLPYYNSHVGEISNDLVKHLIPLVEGVFTTPTANANVAPGNWTTTGYIQPGVVYLADKWQFAVEAVIPINGASGHGVGVWGGFDFYLDDIFPDSIGKPIFPQSLPMFTGARQ
jgi:hypothetical protein